MIHSFYSILANAAELILILRLASN